MNKAFTMNLLKSGYYLYPNIKGSCKTKFFITILDNNLPKLEKIFKGVGKKIDNHKKSLILTSIIIQSANSGFNNKKKYVFIGRFGKV